MKTFKIPFIYERWALAEVEAETLEEAVANFYEKPGYEQPIVDGRQDDLEDTEKIDIQGVGLYNFDEEITDDECKRIVKEGLRIYSERHGGSVRDEWVKAQMKGIVP